MVEPRLPFFSEPVVSSKAPPATDTFGFTWQEVVTRVEGFVIEATDKLLEVANYTHEETRASLTDGVHNMANHVFLLHLGEYVTKVEVFYTETAVTGLKIYTTKRVTPWYGSTAGSRVVFEADAGFCINAFRGKYGPDGCSELGVVYAPKEIVAEGHCVVTPAVVFKAVTLDDDDVDSADSDASDGDVHDGADFGECTIDLSPRAIVIETSETGVDGVRVVTAAEYDRVVRFPQSFEYVPGEQWLVLAEGERIEAVGVVVDAKRLVSIAFKTNLHTSPLYGSCSSSKIQWLVDEEHPGSFVCGFACGAADADGEDEEDQEEDEGDEEDFAIDRFSIIWTKPSDETAASQQASKAA